MRKVIAVGIVAVSIMATNRVGAEPSVAPAGSQAAISRAAAAGKFLFVFVTDNNNDATQATRKTFETAVAKLADQAQWVAVNRTDTAEKEFVQKNGLATAPMPLVLAFAPNGAITDRLSRRAVDRAAIAGRAGQSRLATVLEGVAGAQARVRLRAERQHKIQRRGAARRERVQSRRYVREGNGGRDN